MHTIIRDFSKSFIKLTIWQPDGSRVETTALGTKGILYWARTSNGKVLVGIDRDGLDSILGILGSLEKEELAALHFALKDLREAGLEQLEVDVNLTGEGDRFKIAYRDVATDSATHDSFDDVSEFLVRKRGYSHPG
ncbi:hypothetical protein [Sinorhizobium meliloti]|uniref:hypothetical protein n=1 Tax=Rhizobium meliloti TaxID=382 RepID=UPI000B4A105A|nr:hypothetical protein [Sinorhizobium meliloti]ASP68616.1 hypothetical protein CDO29_29885 [Sinorhizobium meliloti]MQX04591.1 hypothetical protein [Sinorhizobium meliloti]RVG01748.1 hypothetical protein CN234_30840 [Sinorhizobium meliloti]RVK41461.1 hypothetical protein CN160_32925 [Sinorhizobium meliloti]